MPRPQRAQLPTDDPNLRIVVSDDGSRTLKKIDTGDTWRSESGAILESQLVFLENGGVAQHFRDGNPVHIFEIGFGTGLNFWLTASEAMRSGAQLTYVGVEPFPLPLNIVQQLCFDQVSNCNPAIDEFLVPVFDSLHRSEDADSNSQLISIRKDTVELKLIRDKFETADLKGFLPFDVVYHDPFGPDSVPELWTETTMRRLHTVLRDNGRLVTYCVKSSVQRLLKDIGFRVEKTKGPAGGKREVLIATKLSS